MFDSSYPYAMSDIESKLNVKKPKYFSFALIDLANNKPVAILVREELNILVGNDSSFQFLCIGGYAAVQQSQQFVLLESSDKLPMFLIEVNASGERYRYVGDYFCVGESTERQTLGMFSFLVEKIRTDKNKKEYILEKVICISKVDPSNLKKIYEVNLPITLDVTNYNFSVGVNDRLNFQFN